MVITGCAALMHDSGTAPHGFAPACGGGLGEPTGWTGVSSKHPIWSLGWQGITTSSYGQMTPIREEGKEWITLKTPVTVTPDTSGTLQIIEPETARLVVTNGAKWAKAGDGTSLLPGSSRTLNLPSCKVSDTYPGMLLVPRPMCVTIKVTPSNAAAYEVIVPAFRDMC